MLILEGLDLSDVAPGSSTMVAVPLRLVGLEASPVRALLLPATSADGVTERAGAVGDDD